MLALTWLWWAPHGRRWYKDVNNIYRIKTSQVSQGARGRPRGKGSREGRKEGRRLFLTLIGPASLYIRGNLCGVKEMGLIPIHSQKTWLPNASLLACHIPNHASVVSSHSSLGLWGPLVFFPTPASTQGTPNHKQDVKLRGQGTPLLQEPTQSLHLTSSFAMRGRSVGDKEVKVARP